MKVQAMYQFWTEYRYECAFLLVDMFGFVFPFCKNSMSLSLVVLEHELVYELSVKSIDSLRSIAKYLDVIEQQHELDDLTDFSKR